MKKIITFLTTTIVIFNLTFTIISAENINHSQNLELSMVEKYKLLTETALEHQIPPEILKAIAFSETGMMQFDNGEPIITSDNGIGLMQVTTPNFPVDEERLKYDTAYNIEIGAKVLKEKWNLQFYEKIPKINNSQPEILENWYFAVMAYNGVSRINDPNYNETSYQEKVFDYINDYSLVDVGRINSLRLNYDENDNLKFPRLQYNTNKQTVSTQMFQTGDKVFVMNDTEFLNYANVREKPDLNEAVKLKAPYYTDLEIVSGPYFPVQNDANHFVIYEVKGNSFQGFVSSSNLRPKENKEAVFLNWTGTTENEVKQNKVWSIKMNTRLDPESVNHKNIYVEDHKGDGVFIKLSYDDTKNFIKVAPVEQYQKGQTYTLKIKNLRSLSGKEMVEPIKLTFKVL